MVYSTLTDIWASLDFFAAFINCPDRGDRVRLQSVAGFEAASLVLGFCASKLRPV